jgi:hypothetical protein
MKVLISLVGGRPLPNILISMHFAPDALYFVVSADSVGKGRDYEKTLQALPPHLQPRDRKVVKPYVMEESIKACMKFAELHPEAELIFNSTLGPKTMAFGMYEACKQLREAGRQADVCYLGGGDRLIWVYAGGEEQVKIGLEEYFQSYGWSRKPQADVPTERLKDLADLLVKNIMTAPQLLTLMRNADRGKGKRTIHYKNQLPDAQCALLKDIEQLGFLLNVQCGDQATSWTIPDDEEGRLLLSGAWLEYHVYLTAKSLVERGKSLFHECGWSIEDANNKGEVDFAGITGGQLVIASCKTEQSIERKWLEELYGRAEQLGKGMCSALFITTVSRASRSAKDLEEYTRWMQDRQVTILFAEDLSRLDLVLRKIVANDKSAEPQDVPLYPRI